MKYSVDKQEKYTLFSLQEEKADSILAPEIKSKMLTLNAEGMKNLVLDLTGVKYMDSSGLSALLRANSICTGANGIMVLFGLSDHVMKLIQISQLDKVFTILPTLEESVDAVFMHELENDLKAQGDSE